MIEDTRPLGNGGVYCTLRQINPEMADIYEALHRFEGDDPSLMDAFDMKLTPYTSTVKLGDHTFTTGEYRMHPKWSQMETNIFDKDDLPLTTADLDQRDHFASEVRALHPTQEYRIEKLLHAIHADIRMIQEMLRTN